MPFVQQLNISSISGDTPEAKLDSLVRQLNEWAAEISNEKLTIVQRGEDGEVRIVQGSQIINGVRLVGTVYYDTSNIPRILIGLHPTTNLPGIWISKDGIDVITELTT